MPTVKERTVQTSELIVVAQESGLAEDKVKNLLSKFGENFKAAQHIAEEARSIVVTDETQVEDMQNARHARLELKNIRVAVEHTRKELKEQSLREGKAIDGMANIIKALVIPIEEHLEKQEKFAENLAIERKKKINAERLALLLSLTETPDMYSYEEMDNSTFDTLINHLKELKAEKLAAEKQAEAERLAKEKAEREEQERIRKENAALKAEAEAKEKLNQRKIDRINQLTRLGMAWDETASSYIRGENKVSSTQILNDTDDEYSDRVEVIRVSIESQLAEAELQRKAQEEKANQERQAAELERKKREELEQAERDRIAQEVKAKQDEEAKERASLLAPDKAKLIEFANKLDALEMPNVKNREAGKLLDETQEFLSRISKNLRNKAKEL